MRFLLFVFFAWMSVGLAAAEMPYAKSVVVEANLVVSDPPVKAKPALYDTRGKLSGWCRNAIQRILDTANGKGLTMYAWICSKSDTEKNVEATLKAKTASNEYDIAFAYYWDAKRKGWSLGIFSSPNEGNSNQFKIVSAMMLYSLNDRCGACKRKLSSNQLGMVVLGGLRQLYQLYVHNREPASHSVETYPYLPLSDALEAQIEQYGAILERMVDHWEKVRVVHTTATKATSISYPVYMARVKTFVDSMRAATDLIKNDIVSNATVGSMYAQPNVRYTADQQVNLFPNGHDFYGDLRHDRAITVFKRVLNTGRIPQMLKEVAALEYFFAYKYLDDIYAFAGMSDLLELKLDVTKQGKGFKREGFNKYDLYTLSTYNVSVSAPLLLASVGTTSGHEFLEIQYKNERLGMKWKMYCACKTQSVDFGAGISTDFIMPVNVAARITPPANGVNHANTASIGYHPPNFFRAPQYEFSSASVGMDMAVNEISYTLAGSARYINGGRILGMSTTGLNFGGGASNSVGASANASVGAGRCRGWGVRDFVGIKPVVMKKEPAPADNNKEQRIKSVFVGMAPKNPTFDKEDDDMIQNLVEDVKTFTQKFPGKKISIRIYGLSAGYYAGDPAKFKGSYNKLSYPDQFAIQNYRDADAMAQNLFNTLQNKIIDEKIPAAKYSIERIASEYHSPDGMQKRANDLRGNRKFGRIANNPFWWRMGMVTLHAKE